MEHEGRSFSLKDFVKGPPPESPKDVLQAGQDASVTCVSLESPNSDTNPSYQLKLDETHRIDPRLLFIGSKIGEGAHGKVYEGRFGDLAVAVKVIQVGEIPAQVSKMRSQFAREVAMLSKVRHKNLVKFIGACEEPMALVTELLSGQSLRKYLLGLRPQRLDLSCAISFALDIARVMDCLHANGIIHRDLKPDNLLLTADQKTVKLVDFGLAREETLTEMMTAETGTYRWMAPELYSTVTLRQGEKKHYNQKVDVYSFGIVLWELLTNRMPFEGMSNLQAAYAAAFKNVRPAISETFPEELVFILQACWAEDPNVRPSFALVVRMLMTVWSSLPSSGYNTDQRSALYCSSSLKDSVSFKDSPRSSTSRELLMAGSCKDSQSSSTSKELNLVASSSNSRDLETKPSRLFQCFGHCFVAEAAGSITESV